MPALAAMTMQTNCGSRRKQSRWAFIRAPQHRLLEVHAIFWKGPLTHEYKVAGTYNCNSETGSVPLYTCLPILFGSPLCLSYHFARFRSRQHSLSVVPYWFHTKFEQFLTETVIADMAVPSLPTSGQLGGRFSPIGPFTGRQWSCIFSLPFISPWQQSSGIISVVSLSLVLDIRAWGPCLWDTVGSWSCHFLGLAWHQAAYILCLW